MTAHYDDYDYPSYWIGRDYEHKSETIAIKSLLGEVENIKSILEIGAGYGRLLPTFLYRSKKIFLSDPSAKLLSIARKNINIKHLNTRVFLIQSNIEKLKNKLKRKKFDLIIMVRVIHHIHDLDTTFDTISSHLNDRGYFLFEFPNKRHFKAIMCEFFKGNFTYPIDIFPKDLTTKKNLDKKTLPFINYHPDIILEKLKNHGFELVDSKSVSNLRSTFFKNIFPLSTLLSWENKLQDILSLIYFGPSIFLLLRKKTAS